MFYYVVVGYFDLDVIFVIKFILVMIFFGLFLVLLYLVDGVFVGVDMYMWVVDFNLYNMIG